MARSLTWSKYIELQGLAAQRIIDSFDKLRDRKKQLVSDVSEKISAGSEPFDKVQQLKDILDEELALLTSARSQVNYFLHHKGYLRGALQGSKFSKSTAGILSALQDIFYRLGKIKGMITKELVGLLKCLGNKDFFHYSVAFEIPTEKKKCPYETEKELYAEIDEILKKEKGFITEILAPTSFNLRFIFRKGALPIITAVIVAISTMAGNGANEAKPNRGSSKTSVGRKALSSQKATVQLSRGLITPKGGFPTILAKKGHTVLKYFEDYKDRGGRLNLQKYVGKFMELNGTDKLKIGNIYRLPNL